jgi:hypothetical protein
VLRPATTAGSLGSLAFEVIPDGTSQ